jgi:hypothetical protein
MASSKMKTVVVGTAAVILAIGAAFLGVKTVHWVRSAHAPDIQGAWAGTFEAGQQKWPLMYKISRMSGSYHAIEVDPYQGVREIPVNRVIYDYPKVRIEQNAIGFTYEATLNPKTMEMSGTWKQGKGSGPFAMKLSPPAGVSRTHDRKRLRAAEGFGPAGLLEGNVEAGKHHASGGPQNCRADGWHLSGGGG